MVAEGLLAIAAVGSELKGDFAFVDAMKSVHIGSKRRQSREASEGHGEAGEFTEKMIIGAGAEGKISRGIPEMVG